MTHHDRFRELAEEYPALVAELRALAADGRGPDAVRVDVVVRSHRCED